MILYCHPYHPLILKHRDVLVNPGWAGALSFRSILYSTGNQQTPAPRSSKPRVSRLLGKAEICQSLISVGTVMAGGGELILTDRPYDPHRVSCCMEDGVVSGSELVGGGGCACPLQDLDVLGRKGMVQSVVIVLSSSRSLSFHTGRSRPAT